jgi:hypothetical protein
MAKATTARTDWHLRNVHGITRVPDGTTPDVAHEMDHARWDRDWQHDVKDVFLYIEEEG